MHKTTASIGFLLLILGIYNFYNFYCINKLYLFNSLYYSTFVLSGIVIILKSYKKTNISTSQDQVNTSEQYPNYESVQQKLKIIEETQIMEINKLNPKFKKLIDKISLNEQQQNQLIKIFKIVNPHQKQKFKLYQQQKSQNVQIIGQAGIANTIFAYHGTKKNCSNMIQLCKNIKELEQCPLCNIMTFGYKLNYSGKGISFGLRYGKGIYFSPDLKKAQLYCDSNSNDDNIIIVNKIVLGKSFYPKDEDSYLLEFNENLYDSIYGSPQISNDLKQPEICIYQENACLPKYLLYFLSNK